MEKDILREKKILIVDDEPDVLDTLEELLEGCDIVRAGSFEEARGLFESQDIDIAILDIMGVGGFELLDIANEKKIFSVMLTAHALSPEATAKSYKRGAAYFVPKEEMSGITSLLNDVLIAAEKGENPWDTWLDRLEEYYDKKFGKNWKDYEREFWDALAKKNWNLTASLRKEEEEE